MKNLDGARQNNFVKNFGNYRSNSNTSDKSRHCESSMSNGGRESIKKKRAM
jgi:hypothetical protein